jgi:hypothetical protein
MENRKQLRQLTKMLQQAIDDLLNDRISVEKAREISKAVGKLIKVQIIELKRLEMEREDKKRLP